MTTSRGRLVKFTLHLGLLCIAIPLIGFVNSWSISGDVKTQVLAFTIVCYCGVHLAALACDGSNRVVELMFWLYCYIFLGVCSFLQISAERMPWPDKYSDDQLLTTELIVLTGLICFDIGKQLVRKRTARVGFVVSNGRFYISVVVVSALAIYATIKLGGIETLFLNRSDRFSYIAERYSIAELTFYRSLAATGVYVLLISALAKLADRRKISLLVVLFLVLITAIQNNPIATARFQVGTILLGGLLVFPWKRYKAAAAIYGMVIAMVIVFPYADIFRTSNTADFASQVEKYQGVSPLVAKVDYDSFQQIANGVRTVDRFGYQNGKQLLGAALFWVPRDWWAGKPEATGPYIAETNGYIYNNLSAPLWIEFFIDGGWPLLAVGFLAYGYFVRRLDDLRESVPRRDSLIYVFVTIFAPYQFFLLRGSLMSAIAYLVPVGLVLMLVIRKDRRVSNAA